MQLQKSTFFSKYYRIITIPMVFIVYYLLLYIVNPYSSWWVDDDQDCGQWLIGVLGSLAFCWAVAESSILLGKLLNRWLPWERSTLARFIAQLLLTIAVTMLLLSLFDYFFFMLYGPWTPSTPMEKLDQWQIIPVSLILSLLISAVHTGHFLLDRWKNTLLEKTSLELKAAELKEIAMQAQLQSLKLQLDPHFMFNNFSTLAALIEKDKKLALHFLENLSRVYRYMILNLQSDVIALYEELKFIDAYIYLLHNRHGDNVIFDITLPDELMTSGIPPITLQLLIENAVKHNIAVKDRPLRIRISHDGAGNIIVSNNLQRLHNPLPSTRLGLKNITERYALLSDQPVRITETADTFAVSIPLLK
jgi:two-component system, LytTR family, sensor kinase